MSYQFAATQSTAKSPVDLKQLRRQLLQMIVQREQTRQAIKPR